MAENLKNVLNDLKERIKVVDDALILEVVAVARATDTLRKELDKVDDCLDRRAFEEAANLGYRGVSSEYVFLQRTLGSLTGVEQVKQELISHIAQRTGQSYEKVAPEVEKLMHSAKPKKRKK